MAKIYETIDDARRDQLTKTISEQEHRLDTGINDASVGALIFVGTTSHENVTKKLIKFIDTHTDHTGHMGYSTQSKIAVGASLLFAAFGVRKIISAFNKKKEAETELTELGPLKEIVKLPNGAKVELPQNGEALKHFITDAPEILYKTHDVAKTEIQTGNAQTERLQKQTQELAV